ncbi:hypothetical protein T11_1861 [Trichinella zimbabwensis]|uniref:Uncharacterized protein n=1 Tax=Trichinella zimbabwensis TaxID=268475 RepID=A0A0V1I9B2_9BILA|nr:hypothetical protein T11_1861 [Trichinella zimbabwensis]
MPSVSRSRHYCLPYSQQKAPISLDQFDRLVARQSPIVTPTLSSSQSEAKKMRHHEA